jgi:hypothetical protein
VAGFTGLPPTEEPMVEPDAWIEQLRAALPGEVATVTDDERAALLDLARVAAHASERWTAPVSTFLVGLAYAHADPTERAAAVRALVDRFEG